MKVYIVYLDDGYERDVPDEIFATKRLAQKYINGLSYPTRTCMEIRGYTVKGLKRKKKSNGTTT